VCERDGEREGWREEVIEGVREGWRVGRMQGGKNRDGGWEGDREKKGMRER